MARKLERDAAGRLDAGADALGELDVVAVAGRQVGARLGDADHRLAGLQLARASGRSSDSARDRARSCPGLSGLSNHSCERNFFLVVGAVISILRKSVAHRYGMANLSDKSDVKRSGLWSDRQWPLAYILAVEQLRGGTPMALVIEGEERIVASARQGVAGAQRSGSAEGVHPRLPEPREEIRHRTGRDCRLEDRPDQGDVRRRGER